MPRSEEYPESRFPSSGVLSGTTKDWGFLANIPKHIPGNIPTFAGGAVLIYQAERDTDSEGKKHGNDYR